jgi:hypothetical protein
MNGGMMDVTFSACSLNFPLGTQPGAVLTLTDAADTKADVWTTSHPGAEDQPILGEVSGAYLQSVSWTYGSSTLPPETLYVGGYNGSTNFDDVYFTLSLTNGSTTRSATSNRATAVYLSITMYNDPNSSGDFQKDISGSTHNYLVGQLVDLKAALEAPAAWTRTAGYDWAVPGSVAHNILEPSDASTRQVVPLLPDNGPGLVGGQHLSLLSPAAARLIPTGLFRSEINFFWISTAAATDVDNISVTAAWAGASLTGTGVTLYRVAASTTFDVYTPTSSVPVVAGAAQVRYSPALGYWEIGMLDTPTSFAATGVSSGIVWNATVTTPATGSFSSGVFRFVQKINTARSITYSNGHTDLSEYYGAWVLDNTDPYDDPAAFDGSNGWITGASPHLEGDRPRNGGDVSGYIKQTTAADAFTTYLMYRPPGAGSFFVPLRSEAWSYAVTAKQMAPGVWVPVGVPTSTVPPSFSPETQEPEWDAVLTNAAIFPHGP